MLHCLNVIFLTLTTTQMWPCIISALTGTFICLTFSCLNPNGHYTAMTTLPYCPPFHGDQYQWHSIYLWLITCTMHHQHQLLKNIAAPTWIHYNCPLLYSTDAPTVTKMNMTAYLPALTMTFQAWKRMQNTYFSCPNSTGTAPPMPTTSDKNLLWLL